MLMRLMFALNPKNGECQAIPTISSWPFGLPVIILVLPPAAIISESWDFEMCVQKKSGKQTDKHQGKTWRDQLIKVMKSVLFQLIFSFFPTIQWNEAHKQTLLQEWGMQWKVFARGIGAFKPSHYRLAWVSHVVYHLTVCLGLFIFEIKNIKYS